METAGTLPALIDSNQKDEITDLTLTGNLNGTDILFIREMAGSDVNDYQTSGMLANLDLAGVNIVSEGAAYLNTDYIYSNDTISGSMFEYCYKLKSIILPNNVTLIGGRAFSIVAA